MITELKLASHHFELLNKGYIEVCSECSGLSAYEWHNPTAGIALAKQNSGQTWLCGHCYEPLLETEPVAMFA